jgi:uncharacterized protein with PQ loop repeat
MSIIAFLTLVVAVAMPLSTSLHMFRMYKKKSSLGQSIGYPFVLLLGSTIWLLYGIEIQDTMLILTNVLWITMNIIYVGFIYYYRKCR